MVMQPLLIATVAVLYLLVLFAVARYGDTRKQSGSLLLRSTIYPLSLAIYCTTWTFFGSVGLAASSGISFLAIYVGPILVMTVGFPVLKKIVSLSKRQRITSVADFLGARYGKSVRVAAIATCIAVVGTVPYIALQLKAVSQSLATLIAIDGRGINAAQVPFGDLAIIIAIGLAIFTILFGTRHADATEHQYGLMLAIALESAIKLAAFLTVGIFVTYCIFDGFTGIYERAIEHPRIQDIVDRGIDYGSFTVLTLLSMLAFLLLPRQFHVAVVENHSEKELTRARWLFPLYLVLINIFVIPIAAAGMLTFDPYINADSYVLALPQHAHNSFVTLMAFVGGLSAGTAMVIVACVALAIMISNHLVLPLYLKGEGYDISGDSTNMEQHILNLRRTAISVILLLAYAYYRIADNTQALASIGLVSFAALAQLAPSLIAGLFWRSANARGAIWGMVLGFTIWAYTLLLPTMAPNGNILGVPIWSARELFGTDLSPLANGVLWSLAFNAAGLFLGSLSRKSMPLEDHQATLFVSFRPGKRLDQSERGGLVTVKQIEITLARYLGQSRARRAFDRYWEEAGYKGGATDPASGDLLRYSEEILASAIGASSSRLVHSLLLQRYDESSSANIDLLDEATEAIRYNHSVLQTAFDQLDQGITVFDSSYKLAFWNRQFRSLLDLPASVGQAGIALSEIAAEIAKRHRSGAKDPTFNDLDDRLRRTGAAWGLALPGVERILEIRGSPMPGGGIVIAWNDITERMMVSEALREANETLERRVEERTSDLVRANHQLEKATNEAAQANESKTKFLAAAGHDLLQPLNAARLYTSTMLETADDPNLKRLATNVGRSLESVEEILGAVLAISRLESATHKTSVGRFEIQTLLDQIRIEFTPVAEEKNLKLTVMPCSLWVTSDMAYLRRLLQNLVSNAIKYTPSGRILIGCVRRGKHVWLEVFDTGIGIGDKDRKIIFEEFSRLESGMRVAPGLGLGLSIVDRISRLLHHPVELQSTPGKGTRFRVRLPRAEPRKKAAAKDNASSPPRAGSLSGLIAVCIDNDANILDGMTGLLEHWGCEVITATDERKAVTILRETSADPSIFLLDYHLDGGTGLEAQEWLSGEGYGDVPAVLVTADRSIELKEQAEKRGIAIINKPVKPAALRAVLSQRKAALRRTGQAAE